MTFHNIFFVLDNNNILFVGNYVILIKKKLLYNNYLIKQLPQATAFINKKHEIIYVSDKWVEDFAINGNSIGKKIENLFSNFNKAWQKTLKDCLEGEPHIKNTTNYTDINNTEKWFELIKSAWHDENENVIGWILQAEKISKDAHNEFQLDKLNMISAQMSDIAKIGLWEYHVNKDELSWSNMTKTIHEVENKYEPNFETAINFFKAGYSRNTFSMAIERAITNQTSLSEKLQIVTQKGNELWVLVSGKPIYQKGKFVGLIGTIQNIDTLTQSEIKSKENEYQLKTLIDHLPLNVYIKDLESKKVLINKSEMNYYNITNEEALLGSTDYDLLTKESADMKREDDLKVMRTLEPILGKETENIKLDGTKTFFHSSKIPLINADGNAYGLVGINMDITELKKKEEDMKALIKVTTLQNEKLLNFAHIVSHNLRSHTANFSMLLDFLQTEKEETEKDNLIKMLTTASDNLLETINNLNEVVDINTQSSLKKVSVNLNKKIEIARQNLTAMLSNNNVKIENNISDTTLIKVVPAYFESILINFFSNALKYQSPDRPLVIKLNAQHEDGYTVLSFEDNGLGIDLKKHGSKLFGMYKTFHENKEARGIGLYIVKNQVEAMKGKISVESTVDVGTKFNIFFNENN